MSDMTIGFAITGSFCTFKAVFPQMNLLVEHGYHVLPIMSENVYTTDTRFGRAADWVAQAEEVCGEKVIHTIAQAEPIGPKKLLDLLILAPCTGNTLGKLACGIYDTAPTLAVKSHRRNGRPVLIAVSTNDALAGAAAGIGLLMNRKGTYFVPFQQDDFRAKPTSCVADFTQILPAAEAAYFRGMEEHHPERLCIENTRTLMLEMPFSEWTDQQVETVAVLSLDLHFNVVLVHPERFCFSSSNRRRLEELAKLPLALQVNADTLLRWGTRRQGLELLELTATPLLGSDCHDMTKRPPNLKGGREMVRRKLGEAFLAQMDENARRLTAPTLAQV